ncbi:xanthine dehydrogenase accessory protein XdhC [Sneathiella sp. HT1-7]|uniref:xanthine dehydrogenase accessory protein XdhC n=1 Tax=Sneathiella sp. HT1-7 TaxID=2887192 RepID=UPI001D155802|nr:xanthine dehydrogenase accessory protein XdhC [Sneathiella sp. HT1-7]MCC3304464.1 xanthine dehydrogenase accessory protein XdhC [Sneathiella sp. HT1-7]
MSNWSEIAEAYCPDRDGAAVLVTVGRIKGSTPRDTGANMLITTTRCIGTIGGGRLEYTAIEKARDLLSNETKSSEIHELPLGPELAQCCGGYVELLLYKLQENDALILINQLNENKEKSTILLYWSETECRHQIVSESDSLIYLNKPLQAAIERQLNSPGTEIVENRQSHNTDFTLVQSLHDAEFNVTVFGAGHVGRALITALTPLPCQIKWIDSRASEFPAEIPKNILKVVTESEASAIADCPAGSYFLVMTHSHQLDLEICEKLLSTKEDAAFIGLIGSKTKKSKFEKRLAVRGFDRIAISRITCPIGIEELGGKRPVEIALSIATDLLRRHQQTRARISPRNRNEANSSS